MYNLNLKETYSDKVDRGKYEKIPVRFMITGNVTNQILLTPPVGKRLVVQVLLLIGDGTGGDVYLYRSDEPTLTILPLWMSTSNRSSTSSELNMTLNVNETINITTTGRNANQTFIGIGYHIID